MRHAKPTRAWRPVRAYADRRTPDGVLIAFAFNLCLLLLSLASAAAVLVIARDDLYAYEYSEAGARVIRSRVERLNGELIQIDFDRQRQWDDLVAMELMASDVSAARGFLLSGRGILPRRTANVLNRAAAQDAGDAAIEMAALQLLTPGTRARYESTVPLLSRRSASGIAQNRATAASLADAQDFELLARAVLAEPETDPLQFILTGLSLGLAGEVSPGMAEGAAILLAASRRDDYPHALASDIQSLFTSAAPVAAFRTAALADNSRPEAAGEFESAAAAFRAAINAERTARARAVLRDIGDMSAATSPAAAVALLTHAASLGDLPRLRLLAQAAGDRAAAAAKRLPRDGRLLEAARGELTINRDLAIAITVAAAALLGLVLLVGFRLFQGARRAWSRLQDDDYSGELVDISTTNWRPL